MSQDQHSELGNSVPIPTYILVAVGVGVFSGGAGLSSYLGPRVEGAALEQCTQNASIALDVTAQHGQEFVEVNRRITLIRDYIDQKTANRYTSSDAARYRELQKDVDQRQSRWLAELERRLDHLEGS